MRKLLGATGRDAGVALWVLACSSLLFTGPALLLLNKDSDRNTLAAREVS